MVKQKQKQAATLALADGKVFHGINVGAEGETWGEVVFNTSMSGYQEILTDPSYVRQMITFTCPHIGNVGVNSEDIESDKVQVSGIIVKQLSDHYFNYRATDSLDNYLVKNNIVGISNIDTRELVLHLRTHGAQMGIIASGNHNPSDLVDQAKKLPSMEGMDLVPEVTTAKNYFWGESTWDLVSGYGNISEQDAAKKPIVVALDFGIKYNILRLLVAQGFNVLVVPAKTSAAEILSYNPAGVFLSNGPGDPAEVRYGIKTTQELLGKKPIFGICLGHQILGHAVGTPTFKLKFGHRGGNHPVRNTQTNKVEITVQNHGFATDANKINSEVEVTHLNLNDGTVEGLQVKGAKAFSVQYHPESSPGPMDAQYLFEQFRKLVEES